MKGKCTARFTSSISKYHMEMYTQREIPASTLRCTYSKKGDTFLICAEKDNSGYNDRSTMTIVLDRKTAEALALEILKGGEDGTEEDQNIENTQDVIPNDRG